jgi:hypothetical protein
MPFVYARHSASCRHRDIHYRQCRCARWIRGCRSQASVQKPGLGLPPANARLRFQGILLCVPCLLGLLACLPLRRAKKFTSCDRGHVNPHSKSTIIATSESVKREVENPWSETSRRS